MISLLILGVIASLTIPSLIQNTHKKEEQVKVKKALSIINQAIALEYAQTGEGFVGYNEENNAAKLKKHLNIVSDSGLKFITQDGLGFVIDLPEDTYYAANICEGKFFCDYGTNYDFRIRVITNPGNDANSMKTGEYVDEDEMDWQDFGYSFYCGGNRCEPSSGTAAFINATDPTKAE